MGVAAAVQTTPSAVAAGLQQMTVEAGGLKVGLEKAASQLVRAKNRLKSLSHLVVKQGDHIKGLHGTKNGNFIVSLPEYREMRLRHASTKTAIRDATELVSTTELGIKSARQRLTFLEAEMKVAQALLDKWGRVVPMRQP